MREQLSHLKGECVTLNQQLGSKVWIVLVETLVERGSVVLQVTEMKKMEKTEIQRLKHELTKVGGNQCWR